MKNIFTFILWLSAPLVRTRIVLVFILLFGIISGLAQGHLPVRIHLSDQVQATAPYNPNSGSSEAHTLVYNYVLGTGFTMVDPYLGSHLSEDSASSNTGLTSYEPSKLKATSERRQVVTNRGIASSMNYSDLFTPHHSETNLITNTFYNFSGATEAPKPETLALVSNIVSTTGRNYALATLAVGINHYTDRTFKITNVPAFLNGVSLIQTANDDKKNTGTSVLSFSLSQNATVYIAYDPRGTSLPAWLNGWQKLPDRIGVNDSKISYMELYSKSFSAGTVSLGGNLASPAVGAQNNFFVIAKGSTTTSNQPPVADAGPDKTITLPTSTVTLEGSGTDVDGTISGYSWSQVSGPGTASFSSTLVASPTVSGLQAGSYVFSLVVHDDQDVLSAADQVTVTVQSAPMTSA
ncbi:PKD domain-containing protein, partial [Pontibacter beigongshangensis]|uniref:PKD domain-containing protein n=1 Tax=Pontibacter beigongshangensis TaxID=2574733 RepID=UPI001650CA4E